MTEMKEETVSRADEHMEKHVGTEPNFRSKLEVSNLDLIKALNWYSANKTLDDSASYFIKKFPDVSKDAANVIGNAGFLVRMADRGLPYDEKTAAHIMSRYNEAIAYTKRSKAQEKTAEKKAAAILGICMGRDETLDTIIGDINGCIDEIITTGKSSLPVIVGVVKTNQRKVIIKFCQDNIKRIEAEKEEEDSGYTTRHANALVKLLAGVLTVLDKDVPARAVRPKKAYTPDRLMKSFKATFAEGVKKNKLIGAKAALVYDSQHRHIMLIDGTSEGLSVKGASIINIATSSVRKTLRKPDEFLPTVTGQTYRNVMNLIKHIKSTEQAPRPRATETWSILAIW